jgi:hypothetical protein
LTTCQSILDATQNTTQGADFHGMMDFSIRMVAFPQHVSAWFDLFENLAVQASKYG